MSEYIPRAAALQHESAEPNTCSKISFETSEDAQKEIAWQRAAESHFGGKIRKSAKSLRVYLCPLCHKYHLTTQKSVKYLGRRRKVKDGYS